MRRLAFTLLPLLVLGCNREPAAPGSIPTPTFSATTDWTQGFLLLDVDVPLDPNDECIPEPYHVDGKVPLRMHEVSNGAGGYSYFLQFLPPAQWDSRLSLTGLWSGKIWWLKTAAPYNESFRIGMGEVFSFHFNEKYESDDGQRLYNRGRYHLTINAGGQLVVEHADYSWTCDWKHS